MNQNQPAEPGRPPAPTLPAGHPLEAKLEAWTKLREQLRELAAHLEYLKLMVRLDQRRR